MKKPSRFDLPISEEALQVAQLRHFDVAVFGMNMLGLTWLEGMLEKPPAPQAHCLGIDTHTQQEQP